MGRNFMRTENAERRQNMDILSVRPAGMLPADSVQQARWLLGAQAESLCSKLHDYARNDRWLK